MALHSDSTFGYLNAAQTYVRLPVSGMGGVSFQIAGTFAGTITFEATVDGKTFQALLVTPPNSTSAVTTATTTGIWIGGCVGCLAVQARMSAYTSGVAQITIESSAAAPAGSGGGGGGGGTSSTFGAAFPGDGTAIGFIDASGNMAGGTLDAAGFLKVNVAAGGAGGGDVNLIEVDGVAITLGQKTMAASLPIVIASDQSTVPVSGTVTANIGTVGTLATAAKQDTGNTSLASIDGKITAVNTGAVVITSGTITTVSSVTAIANALPAGNNNIGDVDIASIAAGNNNIGDVDVASIVPGTGATNLGKAEDGGHTSGDVGVFALAVRNDTPNTAVSNTNADYSQISTSSTGALRMAPPAEDFAALANGPSVKKYYTNAGAVTDGIVWSPAGGTRWYVTDIFIGVSAACTVTLEDDKAGGDEAVFKMEFAANSGWSHGFETPLFSGEDAADLLVTTSAGNVYITITGYEI